MTQLREPTRLPTRRTLVPEPLPAHLARQTPPHDAGPPAATYDDSAATLLRVLDHLRALPDEDS